jgi:CheY-like chemotaxis protein
MAEPTRILVIDDDDFMRLSLTAYLEDSGLACLEAVSGEQGLERFQRERPDLVITDLHMPGLDGYGVLAALRERSPATPVVLLSGSHGGASAAKAERLGACACLIKPLMDMAVLLEIIRRNLPPGSLR